jgi:predicted lipoprotein
VYSWPSVNPCRVDQETVEANWDQAEFFTANLVNSYGLDALEQLLFGPEADQCVSQVGIDSDWANLGTEGVATNRAAFAQAVSAGIRSHAELGVDLSYADDQEGLNEILRALFYLDKITKDLKLARTAGLKDCGTEICPEEAESQVAGASTDAIHANLEGFRILFTGGEGAGLDDLLVSAGREDLVTDILVQLDEAEAAALSVGSPLDIAVVDDLDAVTTLHAEVKDVTDLLKGELTTVLALQIPIEASGDND